jgi:hypothetical protein
MFDEPDLVGGAGGDARVGDVLSERFAFLSAPIAEEDVRLGVIARPRHPHHAVHADAVPLRPV